MRRPGTETSPLATWLSRLALVCVAGTACAGEAQDASPPATCSDKPAAPAWLDRMQAGLYRTTCLAAARFDGLFGNESFATEYQATYGRVAAGVLLNERDHARAVTRFRLHMSLPQLSERIGVFVGQEDSDAPVQETREDPGALHRAFGLDRDDDVLVGLGYRQPVVGGGYFDTSLGAHFASGFDPYLRARYRRAFAVLDRNVLRLSESVFWQDTLGFGVISRLDVDRLLSERLLARWTGSVKYAARTEGVRWFSAATVYQSLGAGRALAYQAGISGETRAEVPIAIYGLEIIFRRRVLRDWLFLELSSGVSWPRESLDEPRQRNLGCGVALEMWFGDARSRGG